MSRRTIEAERGYALLLALLVLVLILTVASLVGTSVALRSRLAQDEARRIHAGALADAAMARALAELSRSRRFRGYESEPLGRGSTSVRVATPPGEPNRRRVVAIGRYGSGARSLEALVGFDRQGVPVVMSWDVVPTDR